MKIVKILEEILVKRLQCTDIFAESNPSHPLIKTRSGKKLFSCMIVLDQYFSVFKTDQWTERAGLLISYDGPYEYHQPYENS